MSEGEEDPPPEPAPPQRLGLGVRLAAFAIALIGGVLVGITPNPPATWLDWVQILCGASLTAFTTTYAGGIEALARLLPWLARVVDRARGRGRSLGVAVVLTAVVAIAVPPAWEVVRGASIAFLGCPPSTQLRMVASPETVVTARQLAGAYERWTAGEDHGCPAVDVYVYSAAGEDIRSRTAEGWSDGSGVLRDIGPRPDVWLAATSHELAGLDPAAVRGTPIASSPVVLAVPESAAEQVAGRRAAWAEVFDRLVDRGVGVVRADPDSTEVGLLATVLLYSSAVSGDAAGAPPVAPAEVERRIAESLDVGGFPPTDTAGLLCRHRLLGSTASVIATEQQVVQFNLGDPLGDSCPSRADDPSRLVAVYPSDTGSLDHQLVRMAWSAPVQERAAAGFAAWLQSEPGRDAIVASGLRPVGPYAVSAALTTTGIDPGAAAGTQPVPAPQWDAAAEAHDDAQRRARVIFAIDTSGSMAAAGPEGPRSAVAARAVSAVLHKVGVRDRFGLWFFPDVDGTGHVEALAVAAPDDERRRRAEQALAAVQPAGNTPLFRTIVDAAAALEPDDPAQSDAVVVLTDGKDTSSGLAVDAVRTRLAGSGVRLIAITIGEVRCADSGLAVLATATAGQCVDADLSNLPSTLDTATAGLWGRANR